jgi:hypothetical protein
MILSPLTPSESVTSVHIRLERIVHCFLDGVGLGGRLLLSFFIPIILMHRHTPVSIMLLRHMAIDLGSTLECLHALPAHMCTAGRTLHMIATLSLLNRHAAGRTVSDIILFPPLFERFRV